MSAGPPDHWPFPTWKGNPIPKRRAPRRAPTTPPGDPAPF